MSYSNPVLDGAGVVSNQSVYTTVTDPRHLPGTRARLDDGRTFEYVRSDHGTAIGHGKLVTYDPIAAAVDKVAVQAAAGIGATSVAVTVTVTLVANELAGGYLSIDSTPGEGELYRIIGHAVHASGTLTLQLGRGLVVALTTSTRATIIFSACSVKISAGVTVSTDPVEVAAGVTLVDVGVGSTTPQYFWVQKTGLANVLFGTQVGAVGQCVYHGEDAGSFQSVVETDTEKQQVLLGTIAALLPIDTEYHAVYLSIV